MNTDEHGWKGKKVNSNHRPPAAFVLLCFCL
jgi:hypothetical protein